MKNLGFLSHIPYWLIIAALGWFIVFHKSTGPIPQPKIVTVHDTVKTIDTLWVKKVKHDTVSKIVEKIVVTPPETIKVVPPLDGVTVVSIPKNRGDSSLVLGYSLRPDTSGSYLFHNWQYQYWTPGPLKSIYLNHGVPALDFYDPPTTCDLKCKGEWAGGGAAFITILRAFLGK